MISRHALAVGQSAKTSEQLPVQWRRVIRSVGNPDTFIAGQRGPAGQNQKTLIS